jgi:hypothetical protein
MPADHTLHLWGLARVAVAGTVSLGGALGGGGFRPASARVEAEWRRGIYDEVFYGTQYDPTVVLSVFLYG